MSDGQSRAEFLATHPNARAWAALDRATNEQLKVTPGAIRIEEAAFANKRAIVIGSGVGGLTTAYELLAQKSGMSVTVLEAQNRTGGRCLSLRTGDTLTEDVDSDLFDSRPGETQVVRFAQPVGDSEPYLNAGPGRIPSAHKRLLNYLRKFGVAVEVYVMNSASNLVQMSDGPLSPEPIVYRRLDHNTRGWLAQMIYENVDELLQSPNVTVAEKDMSERADQLKSLMIVFGELTANGKYAPTAGDDGFENARSRAGFKVLPGVDAGEIADAISLDTLLDSEFWKKTRFFQPADFLWQPTLFQPVGGMDRVQHAFAQQVAILGGDIHLNSPVRSIDWDRQNSEFVVQVEQVGTDNVKEFRADYCFSNAAMPFLKNMLSDALQGGTQGGFSDKFKESLHAIYRAQFEPSDTPDKNGYVARFLANTTKVGWQGDRSLWQGRPLADKVDADRSATTLSIDDSEVGLVPIYGGISWTDHEIVQIWYPSNAYHDEKGTLTGAYNFSTTAFKWGTKSWSDRLDIAREGARVFGDAFSEGLHSGVAIAWQNMPYIKGGWAQWQVLGEAAVGHFNVIAQGTGVDDANSEQSQPVFFVVGDQISSLPGWQEGAIASALNALSRLARPDLAIPYVSAVPDTRLMVEGI